MHSSDQMARRRRCLGPAYRLFYDKPFQPVRAQGVWLYDADGRAFLDAYNNVPHVGHCHPAVVEAIAAQTAKLNIHTRYLTDNVLTYSESLTATLPKSLEVSMFTCTGSEANDLAFRIARACTDNTGLIVTTNAYHGNTSAIAQASPAYEAFEGLGTHVETVPPPQAGVDSTFGGAVAQAIHRLRDRGVKPAALLVDTIFASDGILTPPPGVLSEAVSAVRAAGGLFIADEVQAGFGRTGDNFWGFENHKVTPDLVTLGKPAGNGYPLGAAIMSTELAERFAHSTRYFNTFGGNPVACAAGQAVLDVISADHLQRNAFEVGKFLREGLVTLFAQHELPVQVRGRGLFIGVELLQNQTTPESFAKSLATFVANWMRANGVLINPTGSNANVLKIRPPMPFSQENAKQLLNTMGAALAAAQTQLSEEQ